MARCTDEQIKVLRDRWWCEHPETEPVKAEQADLEPPWAGWAGLRWLDQGHLRMMGNKDAEPSSGPSQADSPWGVQEDALGVLAE